MNQLQKRILSVLKESKKPTSIPNISFKLGVKNEVNIITEIDLLNNNGFVEIERSSGGRIKKVWINKSGEEFFYEDNKVLNKQDIQLQIEEMKIAIETLNQALNASTPEEKRGLLDRADKVISVLNGGSQLAGIIFNLLKGI